MPRLISADALKELIDNGFDLDFDEVPETKRELFRMIDEQPTVDAEPVRHGHWINDFSSPLKCSSCGIVSKANEFTLRRDFKFCPYCGAKMDEVRDE